MIVSNIKVNENKLEEFVRVLLSEEYDILKANSEKNIYFEICENFEKINVVAILTKEKNFNNYKNNKLEDIYSRTANKLLKELKDIDLSKIRIELKSQKINFSNTEDKKITSAEISAESKINKIDHIKNIKIDKKNDTIIKNKLKVEMKISKNTQNKNSNLNIKINKNDKIYKLKNYENYINVSKKRKINTSSALRIFRNLTKNTTKNLQEEKIKNMKEYQKLLEKIDYKSKNLIQTID